jgi:uncharacterized lipoprotein YmbA
METPGKKWYIICESAKMLKFKFLPLIIVLAFSLASCDDGTDSFAELASFYAQTRKNGSFYAQNLKTGKYYTVNAVLLAEGEKCVVWAETSSRVTQAQAKEIADEYDYNIRSKIVNAFGKKNFYTDINGQEYKDDSTGQKFFFPDILYYANELAGGRDKKLTILLLDIKDSYDVVRNPSYVAGYFASVNFWSKGRLPPPNSNHYSNGRDMIYIDTNPGLRNNNIRKSYSTLAHELQHLINFVTSVLVNRDSAMDTWIDEGLSAWAEYLYGGNAVDKCEWFVKDEAGTIAKGNNFFVWGNHEDVPMAILDDYATVYLFFRWLYLQAEAKNLHQDIFYKIITSQNYDYRAVTDVAKGINPAWNSWEELLGAWLAANYNPKNDNYGYKNDTYLRDNIKVKPVAGTSSIQLYPGEGVYSKINNPFTPGAGGTNIRYAGLSSDNTSTVSISGPSQTYTGNTLLTFNAGTNKAGTAENGQLTGVSSIVPKMLSDEIQAVEFKGPYVIDARDVLGRGRDKDPFLLPPLPGRTGLSGR